MNTRLQNGSARVRLSVAVIACVAAVSAVHAQDMRESAKVAIKYSAPEARTEAGAQKLYRQLQAASRQVCKVYESRDLATLSLYNTCYQHALAGAVANVNLAALRNLHNEHNVVKVANSSPATKPAG